MYKMTFRHWMIAGSTLCLLTLAACQDSGNNEVPISAAPQNLTSAPNAQLAQPSRVDLARQALAMDPQSLDLQINLGNAFMDEGQYVEAIDTYAKVLAAHPDNPDVRIDMGICYRRVQDPTRAVAEFRKALEHAPNHVNGNLNLGVVLYYDMKDTKGAVEAWDKFLAAAPNHPSAASIREEVQRYHAMQAQAQ